MSEPATAEKLEEVTPDESVKATPPSLGRFGLQAEHNQQWRLNVAHDITPDQCMDEGFWSHIALHLRPGDEIRVFPDTMQWELVLHVINAGKAFAHVCEKARYNLVLPEGAKKIPSKYQVTFAGTTHKWRILRDGKLLKDGIATESLAWRAAKQHEEAVTR